MSSWIAIVLATVVVETYSLADPDGAITENVHSLGSKDTPITLAEFSDLQ